MTMTLTSPADARRHVGRFYGKYSGEVVSVADSHKTGRIKVTVPSVFPDGHSVTARPCFASGHFFVPPVGAKVWVEFEAGITDNPIWVGTWYPEGELIPEAAIDPPDARVVHTPGGHVVQLLDTAGSEKIVVRHPKSSFLSIDEKGSVTVSAHEGGFVYLNADKGEVSLTSPQGHLVTMSGDGVTIAHQGGTTVEVKDGKVKVNGKGLVQLLGTKVDLSGGAILLGGSSATMSPVIAETFFPVFAAHTHPTALGPSGPPIPAPPLVPKPPFASQSVKVAP
jgi:hypothetical protein